MTNQSSENKLVIPEEFIFDQNKLSKDRNNHFKFQLDEGYYIAVVGVWFTLPKIIL